MSYICPHCGITQIPTEKSSRTFESFARVGKFEEMRGNADAETLKLVGQAVRCADPKCQRVSVAVSLGLGTSDRFSGQDLIPESVFWASVLYPGKVGKPFPEHVPAAMLEDYKEAWSIIDLSPKSSATLARRCLQAMIRDFCGIKRRTLFHEIDALRELAGEDKLPRGVDPDTIGAMLALKDVGNIGAHMSEVDGLILDVEPGEAETLLALIEMLFADWYVTRGKRAERIAAVLGVGEAKKPKAGAPKTEMIPLPPPV
jgi:hypothetical protein